MPGTRKPLRKSKAKPPYVPEWNAEERVLLYRGVVVKRFKHPAPVQELILAAFQELGWPARIDSPLPGKKGRNPKAHLHATIENLNRNQESPLIHFHGDGTGRAICWRAVLS